MRIWNVILRSVFTIACGVPMTCAVVVAASPPILVQRVKVYAEAGRFAGWPANHGIWSWGDEVLVGFSRGYSKDNGTDYRLDRDKAEDFLLARSRDGGLSWTTEIPNPSGALVGTRGMRHAAMPEGLAEEQPIEFTDPIQFTHPDFAMIVRMENWKGGASFISNSYDRGKTWRGPFKLPLFGRTGVMGRTDYIVNGPENCFLFLTVTKSDGTEGRPITVQTADGGRSWSWVSDIGPEPLGHAVTPSTVRVSATDFVTTLRMRDKSRTWIDAYKSHDNCHTWSFLSMPVPDTGAGNPPDLIRLRDGRLVLIYGYRGEPFRIESRLSSDQGRTWSAPFILRGNSKTHDVGYPRSVARSDGKVVTVYPFPQPDGTDCDLEATIWSPGTP